VSPFEYIIVLISIILGLGITTLLTGVAELIKHHKRTILYAPYIILILLVFVLHVHEWWESYTLKDVEEWPLLLFLFIILYPINLYVLAHLLFPSDRHGGYNTQEYYFDNYRRIFSWASFLPVLSLIQNVTLSHYTLADQLGQIAVLVLLIAMIVIRPVRTVTHLLFCLTMLILLVISLFFTKPISV
jgi:hypothetical protein